MTAQVLRQAAALMRSRAEAASSGRWSVAHVDGAGFAVHHGEHDTIALYASRPDAEHIASWHPDVVLEVANWLEAAADHFDPGGEFLPVYAEALAVARAYLGGES